MNTLVPIEFMPPVGPGWTPPPGIHVPTPPTPTPGNPTPGNGDKPLPPTPPEPQPAPPEPGPEPPNEGPEGAD